MEPREKLATESISRRIIREVCNRLRNSDLRADDRDVTNALDPGNSIFDICIWHRWDYEADHARTIWRACRKCAIRQWWMSITKAWSSGMKSPTGTPKGEAE